MASKKEFFGIDISRWQGNFSIAQAMLVHQIKFAILKIGGGDNVVYKDRKFDDYYKQCENAGLPKGCYFFGHAMDMATAKREVEYWLKLMEGKKFEYPVMYDVEADMLKLGKRQLTDIIKYVCSEIEKHGYWVGIYASRATFDSEVYDEELKDYTHWVAAWGTKKPVLKSGSETQMWQFGGETNKLRSNKINGITVDQDYSYIDYPSIIKKKGLNGYKK